MARVSSDAAPGIAGPGENLNNKAKTKLLLDQSRYLLHYFPPFNWNVLKSHGGLAPVDGIDHVLGACRVRLPLRDLLLRIHARGVGQHACK